MSDETSEGGAKILRHDASGHEGGVIYADDARISAHLRRTLGAGDDAMVWHELVSDRVHIDIHLVPPTEDRPFFVLVTSGMSGAPMDLPSTVEDPEQWRRAELCLFLPADWPTDQASWNDEASYWPVRLLKSLARLPHLYNTWLGWGHSIPNGDPAVPYAENTAFVGAVILPPYVLGDAFFVDDQKGDIIRFFQVVPVYAEELDYKLQKGTDALVDALPDAAIGPIDIDRAPAG